MLSKSDLEIIEKFIKSNNNNIIPKKNKFIPLEELVTHKEVGGMENLSELGLIEGVDGIIKGLLSDEAYKMYEKAYTMYEKENKLHIISKNEDVQVIDLKKSSSGGGKSFKKGKKKLIGGGGSKDIVPISSDLNSVMAILGTFNNDTKIDVKPTLEGESNGLETTRYLTQSCRYIESKIQKLEESMDNLTKGLLTTPPDVVLYTSLVKENLETRKQAKSHFGRFQMARRLVNHQTFVSPIDGTEVSEVKLGESPKEVSAVAAFLNNGRFMYEIDDTKNPFYYKVDNVDVDGNENYLKLKLSKEVSLTITDYELDIYIDKREVASVKFYSRNDGPTSELLIEKKELVPLEGTKQEDLINDLLNNNQGKERGVRFKWSNINDPNQQTKLISLNADIANAVHRKVTENARKKAFNQKLKDSKPIEYVQGLGPVGMISSSEFSRPKTVIKSLNPHNIENLRINLLKKKFFETLTKKGFTEQSSVYETNGFTPDFQNAIFYDDEEILKSIYNFAYEKPESLMTVFNSDSVEGGPLKSLINELNLIKRGNLEELDTVELEQPAGATSAAAADGAVPAETPLGAAVEEGETVVEGGDDDEEERSEKPEDEGDEPAGPPPPPPAPASSAAAEGETFHDINEKLGEPPPPGAASAASAAEVAKKQNPILSMLRNLIQDYEKVPTIQGEKKDAFTGETLTYENRKTNIKDILNGLLNTSNKDYKIFKKIDPNGIIEDTGQLLQGVANSGGLNLFGRLTADWILKGTNMIFNQETGKIHHKDQDKELSLYFIPQVFYEIFYSIFSQIASDSNNILKYKSNTGDFVNFLREFVFKRIFKENEVHVLIISTNGKPNEPTYQEYLDKFIRIYNQFQGVNKLKRESILPSSAGGSFKRIRRRLKDTQKRKQSKSKHRRTLKIKTI